MVFFAFCAKWIPETRWNTFVDIFSGILRHLYDAKLVSTKRDKQSLRMTNTLVAARKGRDIAGQRKSVREKAWHEKQ